MTKNKKKQLTFAEKIRAIKKAGLSEDAAIREGSETKITLLPLEQRIEIVLKCYNKSTLNPLIMTYFIMYDIQNDKVRNYIAKYLLRKGCVRVQKSIFLAGTNRELFNEIFSTLKEVQDVYDNFDSIFLVPVSQEQLTNMKIIGENINYDILTGNRNTLFF